MDATSRFNPHTLKRRVIDNCAGFLTEQEVVLLASCQESRLWLILVRTGAGRFLAPACCVKHFIDIITEHGRDYVRDMGFQAED